MGLEQVTIDTLLPELVPADSRGRAFAFNQFIEFSVVPVVALLGWLLVPLHPFGFDGWRCVALIGSAGRAVRLVAAAAACRKARAGWRCMAMPNEAEAVMAKLEADVARDIGHALPPPRAHDGVRARARPASPKSCAPPYGGRTLMLSVFNLMQTIAFYGFGSWVPTLADRQGHPCHHQPGICLHHRAGQSGGAAAGLAGRRPHGAQMAVGDAPASASRFSCCCSRCRTRPLLIILFGVLVTLANNWISFATHNYQAELYPTRIRARAVGFVYSWSRLSAALAGL